MITCGLKGKHFWGGIYFHHDLEDIANQYQDPDEEKWVAPDLVSSDDVPKEEVPLGSFLVNAFGQECKAYVWEVENYYANNRARKCGVIVTLTDVEAIEQAEKWMNEKSHSL